LKAVAAHSTLAGWLLDDRRTEEAQRDKGEASRILDAATFVRLFWEDTTMARMKWTALVAAVMIVCAASTGVVRAETLPLVKTNVAYMKTASSSVPAATYYQPTSIYDSLPGDYTTDWKPVLVDDISLQLSPSTYGNWCYVARDTSWFKIDLGLEYNLSAIDIIPRGPSYWAGAGLLEGHTVRGYRNNGTTVVGSFVIPTGLQGIATNYTQAVNWAGVRWLQIQDSTDVAGTTADRLTACELRAFASVAGSSNFLGNVAATATSSSSGILYEAANLTNNRGMTDQGAAGVGNPAANSICTAGNWLSTNLLLSPGVYDVAPVLMFDLGGTYYLDQMCVWNFNYASTSVSYSYRGTKEMLVEYSTDGGATYTALADANGGGLGNGNFTIAQAPTDVVSTATAYPKYPSQLVIGPHVLADHVRITALSNYGDDSGGTASYRGLGEVRFYVPEPSSVAGLFVLVLLGLVRRRR
jgi:hypothetical protein